MKVWRATWPKLAAIVFAVLIWELVVLSGWRPEYLLPSPLSVARSLGHSLTEGDFWPPSRAIACAREYGAMT